MSRLLTTLLLYKSGYVMGKYISYGNGRGHFTCEMTDKSLKEYYGKPVTVFGGRLTTHGIKIIFY